MTAVYPMRGTLPALEPWRMAGDVIYQRAQFTNDLATCCDRPTSRIDVRLYADDSHPALSDPLTYVECCRDCALGNLRTMLDERLGDRPVIAEVNR